MKNLIVIFLMFFSLNSYSQVDSLYVKQQKESRFKVAGRVLKNSVLSVPGDFVEMGQSISKDWKKTATYAGGILGLIAIDKYTTDFLHNHIEPAIDYSLPNITIGNQNHYWISGNDAYMAYPVIGLYFSSVALKYEKGQYVAINAIKSLSYSILISHLVLKSIFARNRPYRPNRTGSKVGDYWTKDPWDFGNYHPIYFESRHNGTAFPSLHATAFFAMAKVFQMEYNNYWIPYTFMAGVFMSNLDAHEHWVSDLVLGGILGTVIGRSVVLSSRKQREKQKNRISKKKIVYEKRLVPQISGGNIGLHYVINF
jgi:membrane-associated phospholipid phosphatase